jgi:hypothetical protein
MEALLKYNQQTGYVPTVTSANDGTHMGGSFHYKDLAFDIRTKDHPNPRDYEKWLENELGHGYQVIVEKDHIHVEPSEAYVSGV